MFIKQIMHRFAVIFVGMSKTGLLLGVAGFLVTTYIAMYLAGEDALIDPNNYIYWMMTVASTVGFGDFSPTTNAGKWITALWVFPIALSLFAILITKMGLRVSSLISKQKRGLKMLDLKDHIVVIGWNEKRTLHLIELLASKSNGHTSEIVLVVDKEMEKPDTQGLEKVKFHFVYSDRFTNDETMSRACLSTAKTIIIDTADDSDTLTTALYCNKVSPNSTKTAYFNDESIGDLIKGQSSKITCIPSVSVELMAKASTDPGSERLIRQLLDTRYGENQYSVIAPPKSNIRYWDLFYLFKQTHNATIVGVRKNGDEKITVNAAADQVISEGDTIYYIASSRLANPFH